MKHHALCAVRVLLSVALFYVGSNQTVSRAADFVSGTVVGVHDGDSLTLLTNDQTQVKVRLARIDAPELGQPYGKDSKKALSAVSFQQQATLEVAGLDRYGRTLAEVTIDGRDVSSYLVEKGHAWVFRRYSTDEHLLRLEEQARKNRTGLWALQADQIVAPWDWRKTRKEQNRSNP